jgi:hypothetical protein
LGHLAKIARQLELRNEFAATANMEADRRNQLAEEAIQVQRDHVAVFEKYVSHFEKVVSIPYPDTKSPLTRR